jgi:chemotaxis-related protein WspB
MLLFYVGKEIFACDSEPIVEIVPKVKLKKIPHSPDYFAGLLNLGGLPIPVIDFCQIIENRPSSNSMHTRIILFKDPKNDNPAPILGIIAEKVTESAERELSEFIESGLKNKNFPYMGGVQSERNQVTQFVSIDELIKSMQSMDWGQLKYTSS